MNLFPKSSKFPTVPKTNKRNPRYVLLRKARLDLHRRALRAQRRDQSEVCGVLIADSKCRLVLHFLENRNASPGRFEISTSDLKAAQKTARSIGMKMVGTFHSHPIGDAFPSRSDLHHAKPNSLMLIYDVCGREVGLWKIKKKLSGKTYDKLPISPVTR